MRSRRTPRLLRCILKNFDIQTLFTLGVALMLRAVFTLGLIILCCEIANGQAESGDSASDLPQNSKLKLAIVEYPGKLVVTHEKLVPIATPRMTAVTKMRQETRTRIVNGVAQTYTVMVPYTEQVAATGRTAETVVQKEIFDIENVDISTVDNKEFKDDDELREYLKAPREAIVLTNGQELHPFYKRILKPSVLIIRLPDSNKGSQARPKAEPKSADASAANQAPFKVYGGVR